MLSPELTKLFNSGVEIFYADRPVLRRVMASLQEGWEDAPGG